MFDVALPVNERAHNRQLVDKIIEADGLRTRPTPHSALVVGLRRFAKPRAPFRETVTGRRLLPGESDVTGAVNRRVDDRQGVHFVG